jgi:hypothetical protein
MAHGSSDAPAATTTISLTRLPCAARHGWTSNHKASVYERLGWTTSRFYLTTIMNKRLCPGVSMEGALSTLPGGSREGGASRCHRSSFSPSRTLQTTGLRLPFCGGRGRACRVGAGFTEQGDGSALHSPALFPPSPGLALHRCLPSLLSQVWVCYETGRRCLHWAPVGPFTCPFRQVRFMDDEKNPPPVMVII